VRLSYGKIQNKGKRRSFCGFSAGKLSHHHLGWSLGWGVGGFGVQFSLFLWGDLVLFFNLRSYLLEVKLLSLYLRI